MLVAILGTSLACLSDTQAGTLSVTNGSFTNLTGLSVTGGGWYGGVPAGWTSTASTAATNPYTVLNSGGTNYANLGTLAPTNTPATNVLRQNVGTVDITSDIRLTFTTKSLSAGQLASMTSGIYDSALAFNTSPLATNASGLISTNPSSITYTARGVGPGTSLYIAFWNLNQYAAGITGLSIAGSATTYAWNGGVSGVWTNGGGGWTDTFDNTPTTYNNAKPVVAQFTSASGATNVQVGGNVVVGNIQVSGANYDFSGGTITMTNTTWSVGADQTASVGSTLAGTTGLTKADLGTLTLSASNSYTGVTTVGAGTLALANANALGSGNLTVNGGTLDLGGNNLTAANLGGTGGTIALGANTLTASMTTGKTFAGTISGTGNLVKSGSSSLELSGSNSYTGGTTISNGILYITGSGTLGNASGAITISNTASTATLDLRNAQTRTGTITMIGDGARLTSANGSGSGSLINNGSALEMRGGQITVSISGTGGLNVSGGGGILSSNSYTGATTISGTTGWYGQNQLFVNNTNALGAASGDLTISGGSVNLSSNTITRSGNVTISGGTLTLGTLNKTGGVFALQGGNGSIAVTLAGTAGLTKSGAGTSTLWVSNSYTGATTISEGTLVTAGTGQLTAGTALAISNGATWQMTGATSGNGATRTIGGLTGDGTVQTTSSGFTHNLTVDKASGTNIFSGVIAGSGALVKQGAGTLALGGVNTYSGSTAVTAGTLLLANGSGLGSTAAGTTVASGAQLRLNAIDSGFTVGNEALSISGQGVTTGGALRNAAGNNTYQGKITLVADATIGAADKTTLTLDVASGNAIESVNRNLTIDGAGITLVNDAISLGTGGLTKIGSGTATLAGSNTYTGTTTVSNGTLVISSTSLSATILSNSIAVVFASTPSAGSTYSILPGALAGNSLDVILPVQGLGIGQTATVVNAPNLVVQVTEAPTGLTFEGAYPGIDPLAINPANGLAYLMNYALGGTGIGSNPALPELTSDGTSLTLTANIRNSGQGVNVVGEYTYDLAGTWTEVALTPTGASSNVENTTVKSFSQDVEPGQPRKFLRLKAVAP
jgi:autotransporter-associated beta strand protein